MSEHLPALRFAIALAVTFISVQILQDLAENPRFQASFVRDATWQTSQVSN